MLEEKNDIVDSEGWWLYAQSPTGFGSKPSENCHWLDAGGRMLVIFIIAGGGLTFFFGGGLTNDHYQWYFNFQSDQNLKQQMYQTLTIKTGPPFTIFPTKVTEEQECSPQVFLSAVQYLDRVLACLPIKRWELVIGKYSRKTLLHYVAFSFNT